LKFLSSANQKYGRFPSSRMAAGHAYSDQASFERKSVYWLTGPAYFSKI
jgi:hypothetical protein